VLVHHHMPVLAEAAIVGSGQLVAEAVTNDREVIADVKWRRLLPWGETASGAAADVRGATRG
jgi:hypothetical protein